MLDYVFTKTPLSFFIQNLWRDEAFSYVLAGRPVWEIIQLTAGDFSPPLYYILLHFWMNIFGSSEVMLRSFSLIFYAATLYVIYEIFDHVFKLPKLRSVMYLLIFILNPFLTFYAFEARMYMMVTFFITLSYYAFWTKNKNLYVISMSLALFTQYFALFILAAQAIEYAITTKFWKHLKLSKLKHFLRKIKHELPQIVKSPEFNLGTFILPFLIFLPWMIYFLSVHDFSDKSFWVITPPVKDILYIPFVLYTGYERVFGEYYHAGPGYTSFHNNILMLLATILILPVVYNLVTLKRHLAHRLNDFSGTYISLLIWAFFTPVILFILSFIVQPFFHPRYFIFTSVGFLLLVVYSFEHFLSQPRSIFIKYVTIGVFILLLVMTNSFNTLNLKYRSKRNVANMSKEIKALMKPDDSIYVTSELDYHLYQYYLKLDDIKLYGKTYNEIPAYVGKVLIPPESLTDMFPIYPHKGFIIYYNSYTTRALY